MVKPLIIIFVGVSPVCGRSVVSFVLLLVAVWLFALLVLLFVLLGLDELLLFSSWLVLPFWLLLLSVVSVPLPPLLLLSVLSPPLFWLSSLATSKAKACSQSML